MFLERARAVKPNFELTDENALAITTICRRLDGLPLAIELAAARIRLLSPSAMQSRLESRLQLLTGGAKDLPLRQQTLRGTIDWSHELLTPAEQALFRRLAVFTGGCTLEGVEAVCNTRQDLKVDVLEGIESLVDKSLVQNVERQEGESRFVLLDTVREYARERLAASGEEEATRRAHAAYCLVFAEETASLAADPANTEWVSAFELEHDNFRAALEWLTRTGNADWGLRLGAALFQFWDMREHLTEGSDRLGKLLNLKSAAARSHTRVRALFAAGVLTGQRGDYAKARAWTEESLSIARELNDPRSVGIALNALAVHARDRGDLDTSRALLDESLAVWRSVGDPVVVARSLSNLATVVKLQGNYAFARSLYEESFSIFRDLGDNTGMAWALNYQGDITHALGDDAAARALYEQSLSIFRQLGDKWGIAGCLIDLGNLSRDHGDLSGLALAVRGEHETFSGVGPETRNGPPVGLPYALRGPAIQTGTRAATGWVCGRDASRSWRSSASGRASGAGKNSGVGTPVGLSRHRSIRVDGRLDNAQPTKLFRMPWRRNSRQARVGGRNCRLLTLRNFLFRGRRVNQPPHSGDPVGGKPRSLRMFLNGHFIRSQVNAINLVARYIAVQPLNLGPQFLQNLHGSLRSRADFTIRHISDIGYVTLDHKLGHRFTCAADPFSFSSKKPI